MRITSRTCFALVLVVLAACATAPPPRRSLHLDEAKAMVAAFEASLVPPQQVVALEPGKAGALAALKSDRLDAFPTAVEQLGPSGAEFDLESQALRAQLHLAWGEAELTVAEVLARTALSLETTVRALEVRKTDNPDELAMLQRARERITHYRDIDEALRLLAAEHVDAGHREAEQVIERDPDNYLGYRVAADAARLRHQWQRFGDLLTRIETHNPDSNGLRFLRGVAAWMRDGDAIAAAGHFRSALQTDPAFIRAQAQLVLVAPTITDQHAELTNLRTMSPDHQVVRWAGPGIETAYAAAVDRQKQIDAAMGLPIATAPQPK
jgi:hypothetical protein